MKKYSDKELQRAKNRRVTQPVGHMAPTEKMAVFRCKGYCHAGYQLKNNGSMCGKLQ